MPLSWKQGEALQMILNDIHAEIIKARKKHAPMHSPHEGCSVIREEFEELWEHVRADTGQTPEAREEAIQLAAMAVMYVLELIDVPGPETNA
jgi:hypothetical protein